MVRPSGTRDTGSTLVGRPIHIMSRELALVAGRPATYPVALRARIRSCRVAHCSQAIQGEEQTMRRVIGMDIHRTFAEVVFWEDGKLRPAGRVSMTRSGLEGFGRSLGKEDEVVVEATGNAMAVVRVLTPYVARVIVANPTQVKAIAYARIKTDKIDAGVLAPPLPRRRHACFANAVEHIRWRLWHGQVQRALDLI